MSLKEFSHNDIFRNSLVTFPKYQFKIFKGVINSTNYVEGYVELNDWVVDNFIDIIQGKLWFDDEINSALLAAI